MPYITPKEREKYESHILGIEYILYHQSVTKAAGEFTYIIYRLLKRFNVTFFYRVVGMGCMVCAMLEMYRKHHALYEDEKEKENGGV